jgi:hypothetical protein
MKLQWRLVNIDDGTTFASLGEPFDFQPEEMAFKWAKTILRGEIEGTSEVKSPEGIFNYKPIK